MEFLPESRTRAGIATSVGLYRTPYGNGVPVYCANCGKPGGYVPDHLCRFATYFCDRCADDLIHMHPDMNKWIMPDEKFWEEVRLEELAKLKQEGFVLPELGGS
jgi:hypothetical protein